MNNSNVNEHNAALRNILSQMYAAGFTRLECDELYYSVVSGRTDLPENTNGNTFEFFEAMLDAGVELDLHKMLARAAAIGYGPFADSCTATLLFELAKDHDENPLLMSAEPRLTYFNCKGMGNVSRYTDFVIRMIRISKNALNIELLGGKIDYNSGEAWIEIRHLADQTVDRLEIDKPGKWLTGGLYAQLQALASKSDGERSFWNICDGDEDMVLIYTTESIVRRLPAFGAFSFTEAWQGTVDT